MVGNPSAGATTASGGRTDPTGTYAPGVTSPHEATTPPVRTPAGALTLAGSAAQLAAAFLPWAEDGVVALDLSLVSATTPAQPTIGLALVALAALPAISALASGAIWPRLVSATGIGALALGWLALGTAAGLEAGVWVALVGAVSHLLAAALAD